MSRAGEGSELRIGIDLGGTKIAGVVMDRSGRVCGETRVAAPKGQYKATVSALRAAVEELERQAGAKCTVGIGMPGSIAPRTGLVQNANSVWLNGMALQADLDAALGRPVRLANDANCFALSEATDGAAAGARIVFGVIVGTGCGGGIVIDGHLVNGPRSIGGEWGHTPLPWMKPDELGATHCWCGRAGCLETWVSGSGLEADYARASGQQRRGAEIMALANAGDGASVGCRRTAHGPAGTRAGGDCQHSRSRCGGAGRRAVTTAASVS